MAWLTPLPFPVSLEKSTEVGPDGSFTIAANSSYHLSLRLLLPASCDGASCMLLCMQPLSMQPGHCMAFLAICTGLKQLGQVLLMSGAGYGGWHTVCHHADLPPSWDCVGLRQHRAHVRSACCLQNVGVSSQVSEEAFATLTFSVLPGAFGMQSSPVSHSSCPSGPQVSPPADIIPGTT